MYKVLLVFLLLSGSLFSQNFTLTLNLFEPFTATEFAALGMSRELGKSPRVFSVEILPEGQTVWAVVKVDWQGTGDNSFRQLYSFTTERFLSRTVFNDELGFAIGIDQSETDEDLIEDNLKLGKPTGNYRIYLTLYDDNNNQVAFVTEDMEFLNPSQTLSLQLPVPETSHDPGNVTAVWDRLVGVDNYIIRANVRQNRSQSLEDALESGIPIIDNAELGDVTSINIREHLQREWLPGQEIVFQVYAKIEGPGSGTALYSEIVNFYLEGEAPSVQEELGENIIEISTTLPTVEEQEIMTSFLNGDLGNIVNVSVDGKFLSRTELNNLLDSLRINPDKLINIKYIEN
ncbi:MAG: hypothetical protein SCALA702_18980 [Melioribacteraceae bacterium]|nr:MAG: hypothetical protein SCALA702_18980 [Melioribacteraceae bacterium]